MAPVIVDVRAGAMQTDQRIPGARRVELPAVAGLALDGWPGEAPVVTYCACPNDASAARAAHLLARRGLDVRVLDGGIDAWTEAGYPLESA